MNSRTVLHLVLGITIVTTVSCQQSPKEQQVEVKKVESTSKVFSMNSISAPSDQSKVGEYLKQLQSLTKGMRPAFGAAAPAAPVPYYDLIMYSFISCQANWDQVCQGDYDLNAPVGYQACKPLFGSPQSNGSNTF